MCVCVCVHIYIYIILNPDHMVGFIKKHKKSPALELSFLGSVSDQSSPKSMRFFFLFVLFFYKQNSPMLI